MRQYMDGIYYALLEGRFFFDLIHEDRLQPERLSKYTAIILPNTALLSDQQCDQLRAYVKSGGSLLATFETSMYDEHNVRRAEFGLADVFGIHAAGPVIGTRGNAYYGRIERQHPILEGFHDTDWLPGAEYRLPVAPVENPVLTVVPGFVAYPPELAYPPQSQTNEPAVVLREQGKSRLAYFPGDIERTMWASGHTDLSQLLQNTIRWVSGGETPVSVSGDGSHGMHRLGNRGGVRHPRAQLHQPQYSSRMDADQLSDGSAKGSRPNTRRTQGEPCSAAAIRPRHSFQGFSKAHRVHHTDCYGLRSRRLVFGLTFGNETERQGRVSTFAKRRQKWRTQGLQDHRERNRRSLHCATSGQDHRSVPGGTAELSPWRIASPGFVTICHLETDDYRPAGPRLKVVERWRGRLLLSSNRHPLGTGCHLKCKPRI